MKYQFKFEQKEQIELDRESLQNADKISVSDRLLHVLHDQKGHRVELVDIDTSKRSVTLALEGQTYHVEVLNATDQMVESMGMSIQTGPKAGDIMAPMPGKVLEILVKEDQEVEEGTPLLVLEAMKMENILKSSAAGKIKNIEVEENQTVDKNQKLIIIE